MRAALLLILQLVCAKKEVKSQGDQAPALTSAELAHKRHFFSIGEGFEGTASDWTEYIVWLIGVTGVFYYMANPNARRNLHAMEGDYPLNAPPEGEDALFTETGDDSTDSAGSPKDDSKAKKDK